METSKQKPIVDTQKIIRKELSMPLKTVIKPKRKRTREERNRGTTKQPKKN